MQVAGGKTIDEEGDNDEGDTVSGMAFVEYGAVRMRGRHDRRRHRSRKTSNAGGKVLSFLVRAQYLTGNYAQARQTLEKDLSHHRSDNVARLYLGLTLVRLGDHQAGLANIQHGMSEIHNWLDYLK